MIPAYGAVFYNEYTFPATYQMSLQSEPVYTPNTGVLKFYQHTLNIEFIINSPDLISTTNAANSVDSEMFLIKQALQEPRRALSFTYQGSGFTTAITSGTGGVTDDVNGGPLPQINSWEPLATNAAARVKWSCVFFTTHCMTFSGSQSKFLSYHDEHTFMLNEDGTARIRRSFEAVKRHAAVGGNPNSINHVDNNRQEILFNLPTGFRRIKQSYTVSADGRTLSGEVIDDEEPSNNTPFPYTIKVTGDHTMESSLMPDGKLKGSGFFSWDNTVSASIQIAPGYPPALAWAVFQWIVYQRYTRANGLAGAITQDEKQRTKVVEPKNILTRLRIKESLYTRVHTFEASYFGVYKLTDLLLQSGLFTPVYTIKDSNNRTPWETNYIPNQLNEWARWRTTVADKVLTPLGYRQARMDPSKGYIVFDTCSGPFASTDVVAGSLPQGSTDDDVDPFFDPEEKSYLKYQNDFIIIEDTRNYPIGVQDYDSYIKSYKGSDSSDISNVNSVLPNKFVMSNKGTNTGFPSEDRALLGVGGGSTFKLRMQGYSIRQKFPTPSPSIVSFGGRPVERIGTPVYATKQLSEGTGPLFATKWLIDYLIPFEVVSDILGSITGNPFMLDRFDYPSS
jgi:hypothetical protein